MFEFDYYLYNNKDTEFLRTGLSSGGRREGVEV
jgi:hypothetical protein